MKRLTYTSLWLAAIAITSSVFAQETAEYHDYYEAFTPTQPVSAPVGSNQNLYAAPVPTTLEDAGLSEYEDYDASTLPGNNESAFTSFDSVVDAAANEQAYGGGKGKGGAYCKSRWLFMHVEAVFLAPVLKDQTLDFVLTDIGGATSTTLTSGTANAEYFDVTPRITLGIQGDHGWGVAIRYWRMNNAADANDLLDIGNPLDLTGFTAGSAFKAYTLDGEVIKGFCRGDWDLLGTFGVRHLNSNRTESISGLGIVGLDSYFGQAISEREFNGTGITGSLSGLRACYNHCGVDWFWSVRGSAVWGDNDTRALSQMTLVNPGGFASSVNLATASSSDTMFIGEAQFGLQWSREIETFNARTFARCAAEYQYWNADDGSAAATSFAGNAGVSGAVVGSTARRLDLHLIGFNLGAGFMW